MSHTPHELSEEFPDKAERIHKLKTEDGHFRKLYATYHDVNVRIHRAETNLVPMDQFAEEDLRKQRLRLMDEIAALLR